MDSFLSICEWFTDAFGYTMGIVLLFIFSPVLIALAMLFIILAIPIGIISKIFKWFLIGYREAIRGD